MDLILGIRLCCNGYDIIDLQSNLHLTQYIFINENKNTKTKTEMAGAPIQPAPPTYTGDSTTNEKHEYMHVAPEQQPQQTGYSQQSYPQQPQETYQQNAPQQNIPQQQQTAYKQDIPAQNNIAQRNNYQMATPLASLQQGPAPVDCPVCGVRKMTRTEFVSGGTTQ